ncbi:GTPase IMAP family member 2-like, partial [Acanthochromis polyacanthus]|uniref:GTPase IMAP family member 2-like n=1 Tax=Acanthochromis polyacanthus TaxID=80966 RepID=UPI0022343923
SVSELRVVLLGSSWSEKTKVGNILLEQSLSCKEQSSCMRISGPMQNKKIAVIYTPNLPPLSSSMNELTTFIKDCVKYSAPGPHMFLLVVQPEDFTEGHGRRLCTVLENYSDRSFDHSVVLILTPREESPGWKEKHMENGPLKDLSSKFRHKLLVKDLDRVQLLTCFGQILKRNKGEHVSYEAFEDPTATLESLKQKTTPTPIRDAVITYGE